MTRLRVVTLAGDPDAETRLVTELARRLDAEVLLRCVDRIELLAAIRGASPDLIVAAGLPTWLDRQACDEAVEARIPMVGLSSRAGDAEGLARLGILVLPEGTDLDRVLGVRTSGDALPKAPDVLVRSLDRGGRLTAVWGPKGAPGRTTVAVELAAELAHSGAPTVLVDGDTYGGDVAQLLGVIEELPTIVWASRAATRPEADVTEGLRRAGPDGPALIPGITRADLWDHVGSYAWRELLTRLRGSFDHTVVDVGFCLEDPALPLGGEGRNSVARETLRESDHVVAVCRCDPVGLKTFLWAYSALTEIVEPDRILVCANRVLPGSERQIADVLRQHAGKRPAAYLPDDPSAFRAALAKGRSLRDLAPSSGPSRSIRGLAASLGGSPRPSGPFARLAGRA